MFCYRREQARSGEDCLTQVVMTQSKEQQWLQLMNEVASCQRCAAQLPLPPRPIVQLGLTARLLIIGQAPGIKAHDRQRPWDDPSGDRLRLWLGLERQQFYQPQQIALMPMGFCYPGRKGSGDAPPRPECAPSWHPRLRAAMTEIRLTILVGRYAQASYLPAWSLAEAVANQPGREQGLWALPHPSPRNQNWWRDRPWFSELILPALHQAVAEALSGDKPD